MIGNRKGYFAWENHKDVNEVAVVMQEKVDFCTFLVKMCLSVIQKKFKIQNRCQNFFKKVPHFLKKFWSVWNMYLKNYFWTIFDDTSITRNWDIWVFLSESSQKSKMYSFRLFKFVFLRFTNLATLIFSDNKFTFFILFPSKTRQNSISTLFYFHI